MDRSIVTANRLSDGRVVFQGRDGWTPVWAQALCLATAEAEALAARPDPVVVGIRPVAVGEDGLPRLLRERIRIQGPTVRPDLAKPLEA